VAVLDGLTGVVDAMAGGAVVLLVDDLNGFHHETLGDDQLLPWQPASPPIAIRMNVPRARELRMFCVL
jgi:hypothetical protein